MNAGLVMQIDLALNPYASCSRKNPRPTGTSTCRQLILIQRMPESRQRMMLTIQQVFWVSIQIEGHQATLNSRGCGGLQRMEHIFFERRSSQIRLSPWQHWGK
jgi:hypothetical protein